MIDSENNSVSEHDISMYIEPLPNWNVLSKRIGHGWFVFLTFGVIYMILSCFCFYLMIRFRQKICRRKNMLILLTIMNSSCFIMGLYLISDPYAFGRCLPAIVVNVTEQCAELVTIVAFIVLQNDLICLASVKVKWNKFQSTSSVLCLIGFYSICMTIEELIYIYVTHNRFLRLVSKLSVILLSLYTCVCFLCTGFKTAVYLDSMRSTSKGSKNAVGEGSVKPDTDSMHSYNNGIRKPSEERRLSCKYDPLMKSQTFRTNSINNQTMSCMLLDSSLGSLWSNNTGVNDTKHDNIEDVECSDEISQEQVIWYKNSSSCVIETEAAIHASLKRTTSNHSLNSDHSSVYAIGVYAINNPDELLSFENNTITTAMPVPNKKLSYTNSPEHSRLCTQDSRNELVTAINDEVHVENNVDMSEDIEDLSISFDEECEQLLKCNYSDLKVTQHHTPRDQDSNYYHSLMAETNYLSDLSEGIIDVEDRCSSRSCDSTFKSEYMPNNMSECEAYLLETKDCSDISNVDHADWKYMCLDHQRQTRSTQKFKFENADGIYNKSGEDYQDDSYYQRQMISYSPDNQLNVSRCQSNMNSSSSSIEYFFPIYDDALSTIDGYLADAETLSAKTVSSSTYQDSDKNIASADELTNGRKIHTKTYLPIKSPPSSYSLMRLRQCAALQKVVSVGYFITFSCVVDNIFQMYSLFGVYGIFGSGRTPEVWPWFLFHVLHRSVSIIIDVLLLSAVCLILNNRPRRRKRRRHCEQLYNDTKV